MAKVKVTVSKADLRKLEQKVDRAIDNATEDTYTFFKAETPEEAVMLVIKQSTKRVETKQL